MTEDEYNGRRRQIESHIELLKQRYPESERWEAVEALERRLRDIPPKQHR